MRTFILSTVFALAATAAVAAEHHGVGGEGTLCLDGNGGNHPPTCKLGDATRLTTTPDICLCLGPYQTVKAPWCGPNETPPNESAAFEHARAKAVKSGSLFGATYEGKPMCVYKPNDPRR